MFISLQSRFPVLYIQNDTVLTSLAMLLDKYSITPIKCPAGVGRGCNFQKGALFRALSVANQPDQVPLLNSIEENG